MAVAKGEGYGVVGFPSRPGDGLIKASKKVRRPSQSRKAVKVWVSQLGVAPQASGQSIMGASTSTTRIGY